MAPFWLIEALGEAHCSRILDFASSIKSDDEPTSFTLVGSELDRVWNTSA